MKAVATKEVVITLVLTEGEAKDLMEMVRNPMIQVAGEEEGADASRYRRRLYRTLDEAIKAAKD